jgi:hypothetical protein
MKQERVADKLGNNILKKNLEHYKSSIKIISVGFWRWCVGIERIVLLDFIHRLVSQKIEE